MAESRIANFSAGPSALPESVLLEATQGLLNFNNTGIGIAEISHRSKEFDAYIKDTAALIRDQLDVPAATHEILFMQGGGTGQFSAVVLNMLARHRLIHPEMKEEERVLDYVVTGSWSKAAHKEAVRLAGGGRANVRIAADSRVHSPDGQTFDGLPPHASYSFSPNPALIFYCENETVSGVQFSNTDDPKDPHSFPFHLLPNNNKDGGLLPLVADYSSSFMSRPIPRLADHAIIFAGVQKNLGPAGTSIVIVRKDCIVDVDAAAKIGGGYPVPISLAYKPFAENDSMPNTPSVLSVYICGLVLKRSAQLGGVKYYEEFNKGKAERVYKVLKEGEDRGVVKMKVKEGSRSWMNVVFGIAGEGAEARFLAGAEKKGMKGLKGHRSVGGIRISLYNAVTDDWTDQIVAYLRDFINQEAQAPATVSVSNA